MINAIKDNKMEVFRNQYRKIDVLLIDDIQFIAGKSKFKKNFSIHLMNCMKKKDLQKESMPDLMRNGGLIRSRWCMKDRMYKQWKHEEFPLHWEV